MWTGNERRIYLHVHDLTHEIYECNGSDRSRNPNLVFNSEVYSKDFLSQSTLFLSFKKEEIL